MHAAQSKFREMAAAEAARQQAESQQREAAELMQRAIAWATTNPDVMQWLEANPANSFAQSLSGQLDRKGFLTDNQMAAVRRIRAEQAARASAAPAANDAGAPAAAPGIAIDVGRIETAFATARASGLKRLRLHLDTFKFKPASESSANKGGIYVTEGEKYLGKVLGGKFLRVRECTDEQERRIVAAAGDPAAAAKAYGQRTGQCSVCGLELTNAESIKQGIGPICSSKYGF